MKSDNFRLGLFLSRGLHRSDRHCGWRRRLPFFLEGFSVFVHEAFSKRCRGGKVSSCKCSPTLTLYKSNWYFQLLRGDFRIGHL